MPDCGSRDFAYSSKAKEGQSTPWPSFAFTFAFHREMHLCNNNDLVGSLHKTVDRTARNRGVFFHIGEQLFYETHSPSTEVSRVFMKFSLSRIAYSIFFSLFPFLNTSIYAHKMRFVHTKQYHFMRTNTFRAHKKLSPP